MTEPKQYLYKIHPTRLAMLSLGPTDEESAILTDHFTYLQDLTNQGIVILAGRTLTTDDASFGIVIFTAENEDAATALMNNDPAVKRGVMRATLYPYRVAFLTDSR